MLAAFAVVGVANAQWAPAGDRIKTKWADNIDPNNVLPEYPRPQMTRSDWENLNGLWDYAIRNKGEEQPTTFDGKILVPYPVESSLSGVMKNVSDQQELWYNTTFEVPRKWRGKDLILHFGPRNGLVAEMPSNNNCFEAVLVVQVAAVNQPKSVNVRKIGSVRKHNSSFVKRFAA